MTIMIRKLVVDINKTLIIVKPKVSRWIDKSELMKRFAFTFM